MKHSWLISGDRKTQSVAQSQEPIRASMTDYSAVNSFRFRCHSSLLGRVDPTVFTVSAGRPINASRLPRFNCRLTSGRETRRDNKGQLRLPACVPRDGHTPASGHTKHSKRRRFPTRILLFALLAPGRATLRGDYKIPRRNLSTLTSTRDRAARKNGRSGRRLERVTHK